MLSNNQLYKVTTIPYGSPWFDLGTAGDVLSRIGATRNGKRRNRFMADAEGKLVIRLGFDLYAVDPFEFADVFGRAIPTTMLSPGVRHRLAARLLAES